MSNELQQPVCEKDLIVLTNEKERPPIEVPLQPNAYTRIHELKVPTMLLVGELDTGSVVSGNEELERTLRWFKKVIKGPAHFSNLEKQDEFNLTVEDYLKSIAQ